MSKIKVSVLTPIYNHKIEYVRQCLESLMSQTMQDIEFILIDNDATQESKDLIAEFEKKDSRFRVLHIEKNEGYGKAMNLGLDNARGKYIGIVESDDWVESEMFQKLYDIAKINDVDIVKSVYYQETPDSQKVINAFNDGSINRILTQEEIKDFLSSHASPWSMLYRKNMLDEHDIRISKGNGAIAKDLGFIIKAFICAKEIYITDTPFYHYNIFNPNASMKVKNIRYIINMLLKEYDDIYNWFEEQSQHNEIVKKRRAFIDKRLFKNIYWHYKKSNIQNDTILLRRIIKYIKKRIIDKSNFSNSEIAELNNIINQIPNSILENIFSIKNTKNKKHKVLTILGLKFKFKLKKRLQNDLSNKVLKMQKRYYDMQKSNIEAAALHPHVFGQYKNLYKDKDIVLVACGPTAKFYTPIKDTCHIGVNRAFKLENVKLDYLFVQDYMDEDDMLLADDYNKGGCQKFYAIISDLRLSEVYPKVKQIPLYHVYRANAKNYILKTDPSRVIPYDLSYNPLLDSGGTALSAMQFAIYTNPKRLYLVGCDCSNNGHFHAEASNVLNSDFSGLVKAWQKIKKHIEDSGNHIELISVNPVGLKGMFKDVYTQSYVDAHPELLDEDIEILNEIQ